MQKPPLSKLLSIDAEVLAILGKSVDEIAAMGLREFADLSFSKGIEWKVSADGGRVKGLTITIQRDQSSCANT